jgi:hypothetical protein
MICGSNNFASTLQSSCFSKFLPPVIYILWFDYLQFFRRHVPLYWKINFLLQLLFQLLILYISLKNSAVRWEKKKRRWVGRIPKKDILIILFKSTSTLKNPNELAIVAGEKQTNINLDVLDNIMCINYLIWIYYFGCILSAETLLIGRSSGLTNLALVHVARSLCSRDGPCPRPRACIVSPTC